MSSSVVQNQFFVTCYKENLKLEKNYSLKLEESFIGPKTRKIQTLKIFRSYKSFKKMKILFQYYIVIVYLTWMG